MAENDSAKVKLNVDADISKSRKAFEELNKSLKKAKEGTTNLNAVFKKMDSVMDLKTGKIKASFDGIQRSAKALKKELQGIQNSVAGINALRNEAFIKGYRTNQLFGDDKALIAQQKNIKNLRNELLALNSDYEKLGRTINKTVTGSTPADVRSSIKQIRAYQDVSPIGRMAAQFDLEQREMRNLMKAVQKQYNVDLKGAKALTREYGQGALNLSGSQVKDFLDSQTVAKTSNSIGKLNENLGLTQLRLMANYAAINMVVGGFKGLLNYTVQYDKALHQLQAISATNDVQLEQMRKTIEGVANTTKFSSLEITDAATVLAQAGLSAKEIEGSLGAIANLATGTGTDLKTATETVTSILNIYELQVSEAERVTNSLTTAMNESKANISGFQTAMQYAGNFANQLGMTYEETAAVIAAAAQGGIRSKSMQGTGLRAVLAEFLKPTEKLITQLNQVGLTLDDIDVKSKGFTNVLKTLKEAGFGVEEAYRGMERRGAAFLTTVMKQTEFMDKLRVDMAGSTAAFKANETQMKSLATQWDNFKNIILNVGNQGLEPFTKMFAGLLQLISGAITNEKGNVNPAIGFIGSMLFGAAGSAALVASIISVVNSLKGIITSIKEITDAANKGMALKGFLALFSGFSLGVLGWAAAIGALGVAIYKVTDAMGLWTSTAEKLEAIQKEEEQSLEASRIKTNELENALEKLNTQKERLSNDSEMKVFVTDLLARFPQLSKEIDINTTSWEDLTKAILGAIQAEKEFQALSGVRVANERLNIAKSKIPLAYSGVLKGQDKVLSKLSPEKQQDYLDALEKDAESGIKDPELRKVFLDYIGAKRNQILQGQAYLAKKQAERETKLEVPTFKGKGAQVVKPNELLGVISSATSEKDAQERVRDYLGAVLPTYGIRDADLSGIQYSRLTENTYTEELARALAGGKESQVNNITNTLRKIGGKYTLAQRNIGKGSALGTMANRRQANMDDVFNEIAGDIARAQDLYQVAMAERDRPFYSAQGRIAGYDRVLGSGSISAQAEQYRIDMSKRSEDYLLKEQSALQEQRRILVEALEKLTTNEAFQGLEEQTRVAKEAYEKAIASGDSQAIIDTKNKLDEIEKSYKNYESKKKDLNDKIEENTQKTAENTENLKISSGQGSIGEGYSSALTSYIGSNKIDQINNLQEESARVFTAGLEGAESGFKSLFDQIREGTELSKDSFKSFFKTILDSMANQATADLAKSVTASLGSMASDGASAAGNWLSGLFSSGTTGTTGKAQGGMVFGPQKNRDSVLMNLMPGEYVLKKSAVDAIGRDTLDRINYNSSGAVSSASENLQSGTSVGMGDSEGTGGDKTVNVYVVSQAPSGLTSNDVLVTISNDLLTGGQTKKLVKQIAMGAL